jgi:hypothetical protein
MGKTDLETDASPSSAGCQEEHGVGRRTRKRSTKRGSGRSEAIAAACGWWGIGEEPSDGNACWLLLCASAGAAFRRKKKSARSARHGRTWAVGCGLRA